MKKTLLAACLSGMMLANAQNNTLDWAVKLGGASSERANAIAVGATGNVYSAGTYSATADFDPGTATYTLACLGGSDVFISKLDAAGNFVWARSLSGTSNEGISDLTTDAAGNVYSVGYFSGIADFDPGAGTYTLSAMGTADAFISKLDAAGNFVWAKQLGGAGTTFYAQSITLDPSGNVHVLGNMNGTADLDPGAGTYTLSSGGYNSVCMVKLDATGSFILAQQYYCAVSNGLWGNEIASDVAGNIYITGSFFNTVDFDAGAGTYNLSSINGVSTFITKTDANGNFVWAKSVGNTNQNIFNTNPASIVVDSQQNVYTTGWFEGSIDFDPGPGTYLKTSFSSSVYTLNNYILKLDASGNFAWVQIIDDTVISCTGSALATDPSDNVYLAGCYAGTVDFDAGVNTYTLTSQGLNDAFILKLNPQGNLMWANSMGGAGDDYSLSMSVDAVGHVYMAGAFEGTADFNPGVGVTSLTSNGQNDAFVMKMGQGSTSIKQTERWSNVTLYPNPANQTLSLDLSDAEFSTALKSPCVVELYTPLGQLALHEQITDAHLKLDINHLNKGVYFVKITQHDVVLLHQKIIKE